MKKFTPVRISLFVAVLAVLLVVLALPGNNALAYQKAGKVGFTIINYSQHPFSITINGPETHSTTVAPYSKRVLMVERGTYSFFMELCNRTKSGTMNLSIYQVLHVPVCGGSAGKVGDKHHNLDAADYLKIVKIRIRNKTPQDIRLYLRTLEYHHYLNLKPREVTYLNVVRDRYVYSYLACGNLEAGYYEARQYIPLDLKCSD